MKIGLISDTHSYLDQTIFHHFKDCDELWHAGDIGEGDVLKKLLEFKPVKAVYGNIDTPLLQRTLPEDLHFSCEGCSVWITHIGGSPPRYTKRIKELLKQHIPDIFICGHSHILKVTRDKNYNSMLYINPGAAGNHGFHAIKTIMRFDLEDKKISNLEVIELGKRGAILAN
jgi:uncharacterized protein